MAYSINPPIVAMAKTPPKFTHSAERPAPKTPTIMVDSIAKIIIMFPPKLFTRFANRSFYLQTAMHIMSLSEKAI